MKIIIVISFLCIVKANAMINCPLDSEDNYPYVVKVDYQDAKSKTLGVHCTGSVIKQRYIILAGHCVVKTPLTKQSNIHQGPVDISERKISIGSNGKSEGPKIKKIFVHPDYKDGFKDNKSDLAIIELETPFLYSGDVDFEPIPNNAKVSVVGTGLQKDHDWKYNDGRRRAGSNSIAKLDSEGIWLQEVTIPLENKPESLSYPECIPAGGDSGSPLIVNNKIRGILTNSLENWNNDGSTNKSSLFVNIATPENKQFIDMVLALAHQDCELQPGIPFQIQEKEDELRRLQQSLILNPKS
jgi:secreted trypsin-like serine protease